MRQRRLASLVLILVGLGSAAAGDFEPAAQTFADKPEAQAKEAPPSLALLACRNSDCAPPSRIWMRAEDLLWWVKDGPSHYPLLTTGPAASRGILGEPGTVVLFGGSDFDFGTFNGLRVSAGGDEVLGPVGLEGSAFLLERRAVGFQAATNPFTGPILARPFISQVPQGFPNLAPLAPPPGTQFSTTALVPGLPTTNFAAIATTRLWGGEANLTSPWKTCAHVKLRGLLGFRYLDLDERLEDTSNFVAVVTQGNDRAGSFGSQTEVFRARSQFYGGQVGAESEARFGRLLVGLVSKVGLGSSQEVTRINGTQVLVPLDGRVSVLPNSLFAKASNIGTRKEDVFAVVPEVGLNIGYAVTDHVTVGAGYSFLYWSNVVRPGDQIDPNVNTLFPINIGVARPAPLFNHTDFWAHGVNFTVAVRF